jgi:hypothetical protein
VPIYALGSVKKTGMNTDWVAESVKSYVESARRYRAELRRLDR